MGIPMTASEVKISRVHVIDSLLCEQFENRIDADKWNPLIMSFLKFYGRGENIHPSRLSEVPQEAWGGRNPKRRTQPD